jgi:molecular chaperone Hsp33
MSDVLLRGINAEGSVRVVSAITTGLVREACDRHELRGVEAIVLGRALTAGCLLATLTKNDNERVRIAVRADGPVGSILVDARSDGGVRGCLERRLAQTAPPTDQGTQVRPCIGDFVGHGGHMVVTRDIGLDNEYQGVVEVAEGEIDIDLERYLDRSEQLPSALTCEVMLDASHRVIRAVGVLCQTFPGAEPEALDEIRSNLHGGALRHLLHHDRSARELMGFALLGREFDAVETRELRFSCTCGPQRALAVLSTLGPDDIEELATEPGETEVRCSYCGQAYMIEYEDLLELASQLRQKLS